MNCGGGVDEIVPPNRLRLIADRSTDDEVFIPVEHGQLYELRDVARELGVDLDDD